GGSSGFTPGLVSPRGDSEMSASVSHCLSSKPCQRGSAALHHGSVAPSFLLAYDLRHPDTPPSTLHPPSGRLSSALCMTEQTQGKQRCRRLWGTSGSLQGLVKQIPSWMSQDVSMATE
ncbi:hypothetical protein JOQ06_011377, partial [Pogonophryne albipinna]